MLQLRSDSFGSSFFIFFNILFILFLASFSLVIHTYLLTDTANQNITIFSLKQKTLSRVFLWITDTLINKRENRLKFY